MDRCSAAAFPQNISNQLQHTPPTGWDREPANNFQFRFLEKVGLRHHAVPHTFPNSKQDAARTASIEQTKRLLERGIQPGRFFPIQCYQMVFFNYQR